MSEQLKPCPFCGGMNLVQGILGSRNRTVVCGCGCSLTSLIEPGDTPMEHPWNTRAPLEPSCTAAERALIEAVVLYKFTTWRDGGRSLKLAREALLAVEAERRAKEAKS